MDFASLAAYNPSAQQPRPVVTFELRPIEDRSIPSTDGVSQMKDVAYAIVRAPGSKDALEKLAVDWLNQLKIYAKDGRVPPQWPSEYAEAFRLWSAGEEIPLNGTGIKSWPPLTPAQRKNILAAGILTVEDLANANDEIRTRIGMGAHGLQQLAQKWLAESKDTGVLARGLEAARVELEAAKELIKAQAAALAELRALVEKQKK